MTDDDVKKIKLSDLPQEMRKWKYLSTYRMEWRFLPTPLIDRVAEQLIAIDYILSLEEWLEPKITIAERQRIVFIQILASIYDGILSHLVDKEVEKYTSDNKALKNIYERCSLYRDGKRTFGPTLDLAYWFEIIDDTWKSVLDKFLEIRNWVHLTRDEKPDVINWAMNKSVQKHREQLDDFRDFIKSKF